MTSTIYICGKLANLKYSDQNRNVINIPKHFPVQPPRKSKRIKFLTNPPRTVYGFQVRGAYFLQEKSRFKFFPVKDAIEYLKTLVCFGKDELTYKYTVMIYALACRKCKNCIGIMPQKETDMKFNILLFNYSSHHAVLILYIYRVGVLSC